MNGLDFEKMSQTSYELMTNYGFKLVAAIVILFAALIVAGVVKAATTKVLTRIKFDETLTRFFANVSRYLVLVLAVLGCLSIFGIETTSFAAVLGAAGLAIGLAFQGSLSNVAAGVMLLSFRPFTVGQFVDIAGTVGTVHEIGLFTTQLNTGDNKHIIMPNAQIFGSKIVNFNANEKRRCDVPVGTAYEADLDRTREVLEKVAKSVQNGLNDPAPQVFLSALGDSSINWVLRVWCNSSDYWSVHQNLIRDTKYALDQDGISIPYPQMDVHTTVNQSTAQAA